MEIFSNAFLFDFLSSLIVCEVLNMLKGISMAASLTIALPSAACQPSALEFRGRQTSTGDFKENQYLHNSIH